MACVFGGVWVCGAGAPSPAAFDVDYDFFLRQAFDAGDQTRATPKSKSKAAGEGARPTHELPNLYFFRH